MTNRVLALGLSVALAAAACGDDDGSKKPVDGSTPAADTGIVGGDGSVVPGTDGSVTPGTDGSVVPGTDGSVTPGTDGGTPGGDGGGIVTPGSGSALITSAGGKVVSTDGRLTVWFPQETFERPTTVTIKVLTPAPEGAVGTVYEISPSFAKFRPGKQGTVTLAYLPGDLAGGSPVDLNLGLYSFGRWELLESTTANTTAKTITSTRLTGLGPVAIQSGICSACAQPLCTPENCLIDGVAGKCVTFGNACSTCVPTCDTDNDGYCAGGGGRGGDCAPSDPKVAPNAKEICNGVDDNCDGHTDEGCKACATDAECTEGGEACLQGVCGVCATGCNPATCGFGEGAARVPGICVQFGVGCSDCRPACDLDGDGFCPTDTDANRRDCDNNNRYVSPGAVEICGNNIDDDCNGAKDDRCSTCAKDADCVGDLLTCADGACVACETTSCDPAACAVNGADGAPGRCAAYGKGCSKCVPTCDSDGDGFCPGRDFDDSNPAIGPSSPELCGNNIDDNANGHKDEGCTACKSDADCPLGSQACIDGACNTCGTCNDCKWPNYVPPGSTTVQVPGTCVAFGTGCGRCTPPGDMDGDGFVTDAVATAALPLDLSMNKGDCDDTVGTGATARPGAPELCGNNRDDDCDGLIDEGCKICAMSAMCGTAEVCN